MPGSRWRANQEILTIIVLLTAGSSSGYHECSHRDTMIIDPGAAVGILKM